MIRIRKYRIRKCNGRYFIDANLGKAKGKRTWLVMSSYPSYRQAAERIDHFLMAEVAAKAELAGWDGR